MTNPTTRAAILKAVKHEPKTTDELKNEIGVYGQTLANVIKLMLKDGSISRLELRKNRWKYYIADTAPGWEGYFPPSAQKKTQPKPAMKTVNVSKKYFGEATPIFISMPKAPWENDQ